MAALTPAKEILASLGGVEIVRNYLRGLEDGSETAKDAERAMLSAIEDMQDSGVPDDAARRRPNLYAQGALLLCRLRTDAEDADAEKIERQYNGIVLKLRYIPDEEEEVRNNA